MDSVVETFVCLFSILCSLSANFLIFPSFILLFLYSTVQKSAVQYSYWPAPSSIQRGLEWTQLLKRLFFVLCVLDCKFSNFFLFHTSLFIQYSTEECSTVQLFISVKMEPTSVTIGPAIVEVEEGQTVSVSRMDESSDGDIT